MSTRTINFLPEIFKTSTNEKFLNATMDQLVTEPNFKKLNGYIGRKLTPTYKVSDNYLPEETADRSNYQLEPCVVVENINKKIDFVSSYTDLLQQINYYGGVDTNHSRLFSNESYTFDGQFDFDKLVNFSQYYWLSTGPDPVDVFAGEVDKNRSYTVDRDAATTSYQFSGFGTAQNPDIILARGGTYEFVVNQPGNKFWIQTDPGLSGTRMHQSNINTREVFGVVDNGADNGIITFNVPLVDAQDEYTTMPLVRIADLATKLQFIDIDNQLLQNVVANFGGIDGISTNLAGKYLVFIDNNIIDPSWDEKGVYARDPWGADGLPYDEGTLVARANRQGIWQIQIVDTGDGSQLINLVWDQDIPVNHKVSIKSGNLYSNQDYYKNEAGDITLVPLITAPLDSLYYNDGANQQFYGRIRIVDIAAYVIDIDSEIIGKVQYTSPNGIVFTNGLKIRFGNTVTPAPYSENTYYVEGVGKAIKLVNTEFLVTPELNVGGESVTFDTYGFSDDYFDQILNGPRTPDYISINRASIDGNAWSRSNRWFHSDVLIQTSKYNNSVTQFDQLIRATRPIIEFNADLQLFNYGRIAHPTVDVLDFTVTDALTEVEGKPDSYFHQTSFRDGMTVIFANDFDPIVKNKIFKVNVLNINGTTKIHLTETQDGLIEPHSSVIPIIGTTVKLNGLNNPASEFTFNASRRKIDPSLGLGDIPLDGVIAENTGLILGTGFWYDGTKWIKSQQKSTINVPPLFDIVDSTLTSFSDLSKYNNSSFNGCKIFSYKEGKSGKDPVLGFPISHRNFNNVGDIEFTNNFDVDVYSELIGVKTYAHNINSGHLLHINSRWDLVEVNNWVNKTEESKQYQIISNVYTGKSNNFEIDIIPTADLYVPNMKVYVNNVSLKSTSYSIINVASKIAVKIAVSLTINDKIDILIYSDSVSKLGYYEIPSNLEYNALNENFTTLTLGQFRNHLSIIASNSNELTGQILGASNFRDLDIKTRGGLILQHSAPAIYSSLFLINKDVNAIDSITYAQHEYSKFKNKFLELFSSVVNAGITDVALGVDHILRTLNIAKNSQLPWYYSDMVPYDENTLVIEDTVLSVELAEYEIDAIFNDTVLSNKAILVYVNGVQQVKGIDYAFNQTRPSIIFLNPLQYDDKIKIKIYHNTDGCYVPETPTKLGLYPKFTPAQYLDSTYQIPVTVIRGHDGSITKAFGDLRDKLLLELEKRIYNNIKVTYAIDTFDINEIIPGKFRTTDYNKAEFDQIVSRSFLTWIGNNRLDYSTNEWFSNNNPWTWTYNRFKDILEKEYLPGYWRGIYKYFYDTDAPNVRPWESLGFSERPDWWIDTYGPAPYTGGNLVLWGDLELGLVRNGPRAGIHSQYARPMLHKVIPVDDAGNLRPPSEFLVTSINSADTSQAFAIGDQGPVETAWRSSSDYPFAVQQALALMKPAKYFGLLSNIQDYVKTDQFAVTDTNQRIQRTNFKINGSTVDGSIVRNAGYLNWITDYITSYGADPTSKIHSFLDSIEVRLGYKVAGFTDKAYLNILAEQSSPGSTNNSIIIPDDNYKIDLHKSSPVDKLVYSAVIIEKTTSGFSVTGYNSQNPYFTIIPSEQNSDSYTVKVAGTTGIIYNNYQRIKMTVPYGYNFKNKQQVVDFLISYGRYLQSQGFVFEEFNQDLQDVMNWELAVKEFLTWSQQGWTPGNIIVLSPIATSILLNTNNSVVDEIDNLPSGSKILDIGFNVIRPSMFTSTRSETVFTLTTLPEITIGLLEVNLVQYEHILILDNQTLFNDIIFKPELGNRQYRLKLVGNKTGDWIGKVNPPGFVYSNPQLKEWSPGQDYRRGDLVFYKTLTYTALQNVDASDNFSFAFWKQIDNSAINTGLLPNFAYNAKKFDNIYDIDNEIQDQNLNAYSNGLLGYRSRSYLADLGLTPTSQAKFYQGYIKDKGTKDAVTALANAKFNNLSGDMSFNEEWALRVGEYGATENNQFVEIQLADSLFKNNPIAIELLNDGEVTTDPTTVGVYKNTLYKKSHTFKNNIFRNRDNQSIYETDIETAGYINLNDIDVTIFDIQNYAALDAVVSKLFNGTKIWVAKDTNRDWNVYRVDGTSTRVSNIAYGLDSRATVTMSEPHSLTINELIVIKNFSPKLDGIFKVIRIDDVDTIFVELTAAMEVQLVKTPSVDGDGALFRLHSLRSDYLTDITKFVPDQGWTTSDKIWIDNAGDDKWAVYKKEEPWAFSTELVGAPTTAFANFGFRVVMNSDGGIIITSAPGIIGKPPAMAIRLASGEYVSSASLTLSPVNLTNKVIGNCMVMNQLTLVVSAETVITEADEVIVYTLDNRALVTSTDVISYTSTSKDGFGSAIAVSDDNNWLFIAAPLVNKVLCYARNSTSNNFDYINTIDCLVGSLVTNESGSLVYIGAPNTDSYELNSGTVYIFERSGLDFSLRQALAPSMPVENENFGYSIALSGNDLLIGAPGRFNPNYHNEYRGGAVYRYSLIGTNYTLTQIIAKPFVEFLEKFGTNIAVDKNSNSILISSAGADLVSNTIIDSVDYFLDSGSTSISDIVRDTGVVYVYDLLTSPIDTQYSFTQQLEHAGISAGDIFGHSVAVNNYVTVVGSPRNDRHSDNAGKVTVFNNATKSAGWVKHAQQEAHVDLDYVTNMYLYNKKSQNRLTDINFIDPIKGRILGAAEQDLAYKTSFDPANYNTGTNSNVAIDLGFHWGKTQVGKVWWNLNTVRYIDYEQSNLTYRMKNWGRLFPGSTIDVLEWVESDNLPSKYTGNGVPYYADDSAYVLSLGVDQLTGIIRTKYYFWVKDKDVIEVSQPFRSLSVKAIAELILDPTAQDIPYAAILQDNAVAVFSGTSYINASNTILHIDYSLLPSQNLIHNEYELVQENLSSAIIPTKIINKLIDSLTGTDLFNNVVPDYRLTESEKYGISIRPRQTMFVNRLTAIENFVQFVNSVFLTTPIVLEFDLSKLYLAEPIPLVWDSVANQNIEVATLTERSYLETALLVPGQRILVKEDSTFENQWAIYKFNVDQTYSLTQVQSYKTTDYWDKIDWFDPTFDRTVKPTFTIETTKDIATLHLTVGDIIWVKNNGSGQFVVYRYNQDSTVTLVGIQNGTIKLRDSLWAHNSNEIGFSNDNFDTVKFDLNPTIEFRNIIIAIKDDIFINTLDGEFNKLFFVLLNYILSEQRTVDWAFKTSFVSIVHNLRKLDQFPNYIKDNQSFYEDYINEVKPYRTQIREYIINYQGLDTASIDATDFDLPSYYDTQLGMWRSPSGEHARDAFIIANNPQYSDWLANHSYIMESVQVQNRGYGYSAAPKLVITGGGGSGAILDAVVDFYTGSIVKVIVKETGSGYTSTPTISVLGDGVDTAGNQTCKLYPMMTNANIRSFDTTLKFDRIKYTSKVQRWTQHTDYVGNSCVSYDGVAYFVNDTINSGAFFNPSLYTIIADGDLISAQDRATAFYNPSLGMPANDLATLFVGTEYPGNQVDGAGFNEDVIVPLDTQIESYFKDIQLGTRPEDINIVGGKFVDTFSSHAPEEFLPGMIYDTLDISVYTVNLSDPTVGPLGYRITKDMSSEFKTTFDGDVTTFDVIARARSRFDDNGVGVEHGIEHGFDQAPFDSYSLLGDEYAMTSFYEETNKNAWGFSRISAAHSTTLARDLALTDTTIYVVDVSALPIPGPRLAHPGIIYINGEKITYYTVDAATNSLGQIRRGVWGTGAPPTHLIGSKVVDASIEQKLPGDAKYLTWLDAGIGTIIDGAGLLASDTEQAIFLKESPTFLPWLPGETGYLIDPNANKTRFDDDGLDELLQPTHPFDRDAFDSYDQG